MSNRGGQEGSAAAATAAAAGGGDGDDDSPPVERELTCHIRTGKKADPEKVRHFFTEDDLYRTVWNPAADGSSPPQLCALRPDFDDGADPPFYLDVESGAPPAAAAAAASPADSDDESMPPPPPPLPGPAATTNNGRQERQAAGGIRAGRPINGTSTADDEWTCSECTLLNEPKHVHCVACDSPRHGAGDTPAPAAVVVSPESDRGLLLGPCPKRTRPCQYWTSDDDDDDGVVLGGRWPPPLAVAPAAGRQRQRQRQRKRGRKVPPSSTSTTTASPFASASARVGGSGPGRERRQGQGQGRGQGRGPCRDQAVASSATKANKAEAKRTANKASPPSSASNGGTDVRGSASDGSDDDSSSSSSSSEGSYQLSTCCECGQIEDRSADVPILLCDGCNNACHLSCAKADDGRISFTKVPKGDWYCSICAKKRKKEEEEEEEEEKDKSKPKARHSQPRVPPASTADADEDEDGRQPTRPQTANDFNSGRPIAVAVTASENGVEGSPSTSAPVEERPSGNETDQWACSACTLLNDPAALQCEACGAHRGCNSEPAAVVSPESDRITDADGWTCTLCLHRQSHTRTNLFRCDECKATKDLEDDILDRPNIELVESSHPAAQQSALEGQELPLCGEETVMVYVHPDGMSDRLPAWEIFDGGSINMLEWACVKDSALCGRCLVQHNRLGDIMLPYATSWKIEVQGMNGRLRRSQK